MRKSNAGRQNKTNFRGSKEGASLDSLGIGTGGTG